jgi:D-aminopeptidase
MKKIYVSVDLEGIGGIVSTDQVGIVELGGFDIADYLITDSNVDKEVLKSYEDKIKIIIA